MKTPKPQTLSADLETRVVDIAKIKRAKYNPRITLKPGDPAYERLDKTIGKFGLVEHLVWNEKTGNLVGGHQRLTILENRGLKKIPVVVVHLTLLEEKALNVALNGSKGEWDFPGLSAILHELQTAEFDLSLIGLADMEIGPLLAADWTPSTANVPLETFVAHTFKADAVPMTKDQRATVNLAIEKIRAEHGAEMTEGWCVQLMAEEYLK